MKQAVGIFFGLSVIRRIFHVSVALKLDRPKKKKVWMGGVVGRGEGTEKQKTFLSPTRSLPQMEDRPIRLSQCCTQFKSLGVKILCVLNLHDN